MELMICRRPLHIRGHHANRTMNQCKVCKGIVEETKYEYRDSNKDFFCVCENAYKEPIDIETE
jgi:hypothetical protein